jgi:folate-binding Fe-S cluster repair protein YgfZ
VNVHPMSGSWFDFLAAHGASFDRGVVVSFGAPSGELAAARDAAVVCDLSAFAVVQVAGPDAAAFLQGQLTSDVMRLAPGSAQYGAWCSPKGRMLANFLLRRSDEASYELLLPESLSEAIVKRLRMFVLRSRVAITEASSASVRLGVGGPGGGDAIGAALGVTPPLHDVASLGELAIAALPGPRYIVFVAPEAAASCWNRLRAVCGAAGFAAWQWLTIRAGVPVITPPTSDVFVPQAANWDVLDGVSFQKGLKERLALGHLDVAPPAPGERLYSAVFGEQPCGTIVNAASAPGDGSDVLAVLQIAASESGDAQLGAPGGATLRLIALPYEIPAPAAPRGRLA